MNFKVRTLHVGVCGLYPLVSFGVNVCSVLELWEGVYAERRVVVVVVTECEYFRRTGLAFGLEGVSPSCVRAVYRRAGLDVLRLVFGLAGVGHTRLYVGVRVSSVPAIVWTSRWNSWLLGVIVGRGGVDIT